MMKEVADTPDIVARVEFESANLRDAFDRAGSAIFARDAEAPREPRGAFRALSWSDTAIKVLPEEPEPVPESEIEETAQAPVPEQELVAAKPELEEVDPDIEALPALQEEPQLLEEPAEVISEADLQKMRDDAYAEGFSAGKAMTESEREAELSAQFQSLEKLIEGMGRDDLLDTAALSQNINASILELASARVGFALEEMPDILTARIARLLDRLAHLTAERVVFLAPEDLGLVQSKYDERQKPPAVIMRSDPALSRGDVRLRVGSAEIADLLNFDDLTADPATLEAEDT